MEFNVDGNVFADALGVIVDTILATRINKADGVGMAIFMASCLVYGLHLEHSIQLVQWEANNAIL